MRALSSVVSLALATLIPAVGLVGCATDAPDTLGSTADDSSGVGKFNLAQDTDNLWYFQLRSGNGTVLLTSDGYSTRVDAITGLLEAETQGVDPASYQVEQTSSGYELDLVAANNDVLASTHTYSKKSSATHAATSCSHAVTSYLDKQQGQVSGARVAIAAGDGGLYHFEVYASDNTLALTSKTYSSEAAAIDAAFVAQAATTSSYKVKSVTGGYVYTVAATTGSTVATSPVFAVKADAQAAATAGRKLVQSVSVL